jgi:hypothetical protein
MMSMAAPGSAKETLSRLAPILDREASVAASAELAAMGAREVAPDNFTAEIAAAIAGGGTYNTLDNILSSASRGPITSGMAANDLAALTKRVPSPATKNVEEIFNLDQRATNADLPKSRDTLVFMSPDDFLAMAAPTRADYSFTSSEGKEKTESILAGIQKGDLIDVPHLKIFDKDGVAQVEGHDGRHRAALMKELGYDRMPVIINSHRIRWADQLKSGRDQIEGSWPTVLRSEKDPWGKINKESRDIPFPVKDPRSSADDLAALTAKAPTDTPEFKNFFGESKVVNESGQPLRVYHGTGEDISKFKPSKEGALGSGIYTTPDPTFAGEYAKNTGANIVPVYVSLKNPLILGTNSTGYLDPMMEALTKLGLAPNKAEQFVEKAYEERGYIGKQVQSRATAQGYDGIMQYQNGKLTEVLAFRPEQVKSAIGNEGAFDPTSPVITKAQGGYVTKKTKGA